MNYEMIHVPSGKDVIKDYFINIEQITINAATRRLKAEYTLEIVEPMIILSSRKLKIPKQWKYWCRKYGLIPEGNRKSSYARRDNCPYMIGHDRRWRVNMYGIFEASCPINEFDRWANSRRKEIPLPQTEKEFAEAIKELLNES